MNIISLAGVPWSNDPVTTERTSCCLLSNRSTQADVDYYAVPWADLINHGKLDFAQQLPNATQPAFTICQHIHFERILDKLHRLNIGTLFTPHATTSTRCRNGIEILPYPHEAINTVAPANEKDILFSFVGALDSHWTRQEIGKLTKGYIRGRRAWHFRQPQQETEKREYQEILARSAFALCPRGTGPGTIRFWETLPASAIPVLIADALALPEGFDWSECVLRVPEDKSAIRSIPELLARFSTSEINQMQQATRLAGRMFCGENLITPVKAWLNESR